MANALFPDAIAGRDSKAFCLADSAVKTMFTRKIHLMVMCPCYSHVLDVVIPFGGFKSASPINFRPTSHSATHICLVLCGIGNLNLYVVRIKASRSSWNLDRH